MYLEIPSFFNLLCCYLFCTRSLHFLPPVPRDAAGFRLRRASKYFGLPVILVFDYGINFLISILSSVWALSYFLEETSQFIAHILF